MVRRRPIQPRKLAPGPPPKLDIIWSPSLNPRETYRILYAGADGTTSERIIDLLKLGFFSGHTYLGVRDKGIFKSFRRDRVLDVLEQISTGHTPHLRAALAYHHRLPPFPPLHDVGVDPTHNQRAQDPVDPVFRVPQTKGKRTWSVDLAAYTCTCPEKRIRAEHGYAPGQLGMVCIHLAKAILDHLPSTPPEAWTETLRDWLRDPTNTHIDNLS